jgi:hypothetical protein
VDFLAILSATAAVALSAIVSAAYWSTHRERRLANFETRPRALQGEKEPVAYEALQIPFGKHRLSEGLR